MRGAKIKRSKVNKYTVHIALRSTSVHLFPIFLFDVIAQINLTSVTKVQSCSQIGKKNFKMLPFFAPNPRAKKIKIRPN